MSTEPIVYGPDGQAHDLAWLRQHYGASITFRPAAAVPRFALTAVNVRTSGETIIRVWVQNQAGAAAIGQPVTYTFPSLDHPSQDLAVIPPGYLSRWSERGVLNKNRIEGSGYVDFQIGENSWIRDGRGPYAAWVLDPYAESDCLDGIGWKMATNHEGPCELFFELVAGSEPGGGGEPEPGPAPAGGELAAALDRHAAALDRYTAALRQIYRLEPAP